MVTVGVWPSEMGQRALPFAHWMRVDVEKREPFPRGSSTLGNPHPSAGAGAGGGGRGVAPASLHLALPAGARRPSPEFRRNPHPII